MNKLISGIDCQIVLLGKPATGLPLPPGGGIQSSLLTDNGGAAQRVKVDLAQTSFFQGKMFRYYLRLAIPVGNQFVIRVAAAKDYVLYQNNTSVKAGELDVSVRIGCTETGSFTTPIVPRRVNGMTDAPVVASALTIMTGGTVGTTGTEINAYQVSSANGIGATANTVGNGQSDEIGVANGSVTYLVFNAINGGVGSQAVVGIHNYRWEERG